MTTQHFSPSDPGFDRLVDVWLQMHDVLLPALLAARDHSLASTMPFGRPLDGHVLLLRQLLRSFEKGLQEVADRSPLC
ncbi:hypothetical protein [Acetobacter thailandicus]|uniref:hypothetical protein n=1 Tax=Acetobacter thailandicus TaxID=1502842 RepID=UPI001BA5B5EE|nr:hypothetical protein [Acetobacter thailandicus]MBS0980989.1 hypothetical protein [Acetobacter thailandicus]